MLWRGNLLPVPPPSSCLIFRTALNVTGCALVVLFCLSSKDSINIGWRNKEDRKNFFTNLQTKPWMSTKRRQVWMDGWSIHYYQQSQRNVNHFCKHDLQDQNTHYIGKKLRAENQGWVLLVWVNVIFMTEQCCPVKLSVIMEVFHVCLLQYISHKAHVPVDHSVWLV